MYEYNVIKEFAFRRGIAAKRYLTKLVKVAKISSESSSHKRKMR